jgi:hypothetical protein
VSSRAEQTITPNLDFERKAEIIAADLIEKINPGSKALKGLLKFAGSIEEVGAAGISIKRKLADPSVAAGVHQHIIDLFVRVVEEASSCEVGVLLVFDELQALDPVNLSALWTALSVASDRDQYFSMIAAGLPSLRSKCVRALESMDKLFESEELEALGREDAERALRDPAAASGKPFTDQALAKTLGMMRGYPYFVQFYGFWLWDDAVGSEITVQDIDRLKPVVGRRLINTFYLPKWEACSKSLRPGTDRMCWVPIRRPRRRTSRLRQLAGPSHRGSAPGAATESSPDRAMTIREPSYPERSAGHGAGAVDDLRGASPGRVQTTGR